MSQVAVSQLFEAPDASDAELVARYLDGDEAAFRTIVQRYQSLVYNVALRIVGSREDAEDAAQDAFVNLALKLDRFEGRSSLKTWIYRVAANAALMVVRTRKKHRLAMTVDFAADEGEPTDILARIPAPRADADGEVLRAESWAILERAIDALPESFRAVVVLADIEQLSNQEIADVLELSVPAVKSRLHRARLLLRAELADHFDRPHARLGGRLARAAAGLATLAPGAVPA